MVFVKICGLTNYADAEAAQEAGADALGFVFFSASPRSVEAKSTAPWLRELKGRAMKVGVFVNESAEQMAKIVEECGLDAVQLHGDETDEFAAGVRKRLPVKIIRALRVKAGIGTLAGVAHADFLLVDHCKPGVYGGTGETADWDEAHKLVRQPVPLILSGGLSPQNVREACEKVGPYGVDASSSLEKSPGRKDHAKVKEFIVNAKSEK